MIICSGHFLMTKMFLFTCTVSICLAQAHQKPAVSQDLHRQISSLDGILFEAFNTKDLDKLKTLFTEDLEFYHDKAGLTSYSQTIEGFKSQFESNDDMRRELVEGSLEVYPIPNFGAIEIGVHTFCHTEDGHKDCGTFKFLHVWQKREGQWKISRVVSYGHK